MIESRDKTDKGGRITIWSPLNRSTSSLHCRSFYEEGTQMSPRLLVTLPNQMQRHCILFSHYYSGFVYSQESLSRPNCEFHWWIPIHFSSQFPCKIRKLKTLVSNKVTEQIETYFCVIAHVFNNLSLKTRTAIQPYICVYNSCIPLLLWIS